MFILLRNLAGGREQERCSLRGNRAIWRFFKGKFTKGVSEKGVVLDVGSGSRCMKWDWGKQVFYWSKMVCYV